MLRALDTHSLNAARITNIVLKLLSFLGLETDPQSATNVVVVLLGGCESTIRQGQALSILNRSYET